jgi:hypothetical protein
VRGEAGQHRIAPRLACAPGRTVVVPSSIVERVIVVVKVVRSLRRQPLAVVALFVALGGTAYAVHPHAAASGRIVGCVDEHTGALRIVAAGDRC